MKRRLVLILTTAWMLVLAVSAQPYCNVKTFNLRDGLSSNVITSLQQTPDQLMWFSSWNGLSCYDGYRFTPFVDASQSPHQQRVLSTNRLQGIEASNTGNIWCITYDQNAYLFDRRTGQYIDITSRVSSRFGIEFHSIRAIPTDKGYTWLLNSEVGGPVARVDDSNYMANDGMQLFWPAGEPCRASEIYWVYKDSQERESFITDKGLVAVDGSFRSNKPYRYVQEIGQRVFMATLEGDISQSDGTARCPSPLSVPADVKEVRTLMTANDRWLVAATNAGIYIYDTQSANSRLMRLPVPDGHDILAQTLYADSQDRLWMGTEQGDVLCLNLDNDSAGPQLLAMAQKVPALKQSSHTFFHEDRYHTLWAATSQGFFGYYDEQSGQFVACPLRTKVTQPAVERWMFDAQGNLWFSGEHNLAMASFCRQNITHISSLQEVRSIMFDHEGRIWAGTLAGDIAIYTNDGQLQGYLSANGHIGPAPVHFSTHIYCLYQDREQRIWIGTKGDGLFRLDPDGRLSHYTLGQLPSKQIYDVHQDYQGRIWVGTFERGICLFQEDAQGHTSFACAPDQLKNYPISDFHKVRRITETHDSTIVVSASNGLVAFSEHFTNPADISFHAFKHVPGDTTSLKTSDVMQAYVTEGDSVFISTVGGGLQVVRADRLLRSPQLQLHSVSRIQDEQGTVLTILQDKQGNLWTGRENSINMFHQATRQLWHFGPSHIGEQTEFTEARPAFNRLTGQVALATTSGYILFQPPQLQEDQFVPPLVFTGIQVHGEHGLRQIVQGDSLELATNQRNLTIYFAALDYQDNYMISYAYKLEGIDHDWNDLGSEHAITFNNLPPGQHRLLIRSTNNYGTWVDNVRTLYIHAHPTFWESGWAKLLYALLALAVLGVAIWIYRLYSRNSMERKMNTMKTQFYTDVSHKLRTPLTLIGGPVTQVLQEGGLTATAQNHLEMVERNAHRMLDLVDKMLAYSKEHRTYINRLSTPNPTGAVTPVHSPIATAERGANDAQSKPEGKDVRLLIVEDNADLRQFLVSILQSDYHVTEAVNGREGLEKAQSLQPDFILTDVMMPEMDGLEMVHHIKDDQNISHIPIVILSAKASMDDRLEGLRAGVNDYITKPFSATYLKQRMTNIIQNQRLLQQSTLASIQSVAGGGSGDGSETDTATGTPTSDAEGPMLRLRATNIVDTDKLLMEQLIDYIENHLSDADLKIEDLASALCLGRTVFYNKVKTLVGMSPVELLRHIRIQHAENMVAKSTEPFSQIAYAVGFSDPRYFGKCFKKQTGLTPSEYRNQHV